MHRAYLNLRKTILSGTGIPNNKYFLNLSNFSLLRSLSPILLSTEMHSVSWGKEHDPTDLEEELEGKT